MSRAHETSPLHADFLLPTGGFGTSFRATAGRRFRLESPPAAPSPGLRAIDDAPAASRHIVDAGEAAI